MPSMLRNGALWGSLGLLLVIVLGPLLGFCETRTQRRSRLIHEAHDQQQAETRKASEREARRTQESIERARKEIFGDR